MINYDDKQGTHFIGKQIRVSQHAREQAVEDFRVPLFEADRWIKDQLVKAQFIGSIYGNDGQKVRLFGYQRIAFIVASQTCTVITVYVRHDVDPILRNPLEEIVKNAVKVANARLASSERETRKQKEFLTSLLEAAGDSDVELKKRIKDEIDRQNEALREARAEHAKLMKGVVAYV